MDPVTRKVIGLLENYTLATPDAKPTVDHVQDTLLTQKKELPIGDVSGRLAAPQAGAGVEKDMIKQGEAKPEVANGMADSDSLLKSLPNALGRMARMGGQTDI